MTEPVSPPSFRRADDPAHAVGREELLRVREFLQETKLAPVLRALEKARPFSLAYHVLMSAALVGLSTAAVIRGPRWVLPVALVIVASRQRAFGNILHDMVHGGVVHAPPAWLRWTIGALSFESFERYRRLHFLHHKHLGHATLDPDYVIVPSRKTGHGLWIAFMLRPRVWMASLLGDLHNLSPREAARVLLWWSCLLAVIGLAFGRTVALEFAGLWMLARATTYHGIKAFVELGDHNAGLKPGSIFGYTRTYPENLLTFACHPYNDRFHLAHHIVPRVPMLSLGAAHAALMQMAEYSEARHFDGYFFGRRPVLGSFVAAESPLGPLRETPRKS